MNTPKHMLFEKCETMWWATQLTADQMFVSIWRNTLYRKTAFTILKMMLVRKLVKL